ncbi:hypothetical protein BVY03_00020, partial [bacterium K02(2017)]
MGNMNFSGASARTPSSLFSNVTTDSALKIYSHVPIALDENFVMSSASIQSGVGLLGRGAEGESLVQSRGVLGWGADNAADLRDDSATFQKVLAGDRGEIISKHANGVWVDDNANLRPDYKSQLIRELGAVAKSVDFQSGAAGIIADVNEWVEQNTNDLIKGLISSRMLDASTMMLLVNTLYLKGKFEKQFNKRLTRNGRFQGIHGVIPGVPFMSVQSPRFPYYEDPQTGRKVIELELTKSGLDTHISPVSLFIFLPGPNESLSSFESNLNQDVLTSLIGSVEKTNLGALKIPKFSIGSQFLLNETLQKIGMTDAFNPSADFSKMVLNAAMVYVSQVIHAANITVNEAGIEAGAATAFSVTRSGGSGSLAQFEADKPFFFAVYDNEHKVPLFTGRVVNPNQGSDKRNKETIPEVESQASVPTVVLSASDLPETIDQRSIPTTVLSSDDLGEPTKKLDQTAIPTVSVSSDDLEIPTVKRPFSFSDIEISPDAERQFVPNDNDFFGPDFDQASLTHQFPFNANQPRKEVTTPLEASDLQMLKEPLGFSVVRWFRSIFSRSR